MKSCEKSRPLVKKTNLCQRNLSAQPISFFRKVSTAALLVAFFAFAAKADSTNSPQSPSTLSPKLMAIDKQMNDQCLAKSGLVSIQTLKHARLFGLDKLKAVVTQCQDLDTESGLGNYFRNMDPLSKTVNSMANFAITGVALGQGLGAFSKLKGNSETEAYMAELEKIKKIPNPIERIRLVYDLARKNQGSYDEDWGGIRTWLNGLLLGTYTPSNLLKSAKSFGSVGVCREMAALLAWSLLQVSRHSESKSGALNPETDFSAEFLIGAPAFNHAWVRIHLPQKKDSGPISFTDFDLDTTWYKDFAPLHPRLSGLSNSQVRDYEKQCKDTAVCIAKLMGEVDEGSWNQEPQTKTAPQPVRERSQPNSTGRSVK
jgi:hypothetical protein